MFGAQKIQSSYDVTLLYMRGRCDRLNIGRSTTTNGLCIGSPSSTLPRPPGRLHPPTVVLNPHRLGFFVSLPPPAFVAPIFSAPGIDSDSS